MTAEAQAAAALEPEQPEYVPAAPQRKGIMGSQKAAILMITLGPEACAEVFKHLKPDEIEKISNELVRQEQVPPETKTKVLGEFAELYRTSSMLSTGGFDYAKEVLQMAVGGQKAQSMLDRLAGARGGGSSEWLQHIEPGQLARVLHNEQPQTIALVLAQIPGNRAALVLSAFDPELRARVAYKIARMESASPEVLLQIEEIIRSKLSAVSSDDLHSVGGLQTLVDILNAGDRGLEKSILEGLGEQDAQLADDVKRKMFVFEDILLLDDRSIQTVMREVEQEDLRLALRGSDSSVKEKIFKNMSERASATLKEDMEMSGPVRLKDVEAAQQRIALTIRALEEAGEVSINRSEEVQDQLV